jgi:hypothetical protein
MFKERMTTSAIPERVFSLCQLISSKEMVETEAKEKIEPPDIGGKTSYFGTVREAAKELGLINVKDGQKLCLAVDKKNISNMDAMRKYIVKHIQSLERSLFYAVTQAYLGLQDKIFEYFSVSDKELVALMSKKTGLMVYEDDMRAWRFWSSYLGFGHLHKINKAANAVELLVPNVMVYLDSVMAVADLEAGKKYEISEFMDWISKYTDIIQNEEDNNLNLAFSYGLRGLHDSGKIVLEHNMDSKDMWFLYKDEMHEIPNAISHITIRR